MAEDALLTGSLEPTNEWYAIAKIAGIKLCQAYRKQYGVDFISAMPTNLYGSHDNFDLQSSHVIPALMRKCHEAKQNGSQYGSLGVGQGNARICMSMIAPPALSFCWSIIPAWRMSILAPERM